MRLVLVFPLWDKLEIQPCLRLASKQAQDAGRGWLLGNNACSLRPRNAVDPTEAISGNLSLIAGRENEFRIANLNLIASGTGNSRENVVSFEVAFDAYART